MQAESIAFMVAEKFGIDTSEYSFPYIASWSDGKQLDQLKNALQDIQSAAKTISNAIESELLKLKKKDLSMEEKLADTDLSNVQKAEFLIEDAEDTYAIGRVIVRGDYDKCNAALAEALAKKDVIEKAPAEKQKADFVIYQLKSGDDTRDIRFEPFRRLVAQGIKPDFNNYNKVYEGSFDMLQSTGSDVGSRLEDIFYKFNEDRPDDFKGHSLSVSDVVVIEDQAYYVDSIGFKPMPDFITPEVKREKFIAELPGMMMNLSKGQGDPQALAEEAKKMRIPLVVMREAAMLVDSDKADDALDYFEGELPAQDLRQKKQRI